MVLQSFLLLQNENYQFFLSYSGLVSNDKWAELETMNGKNGLNHDLSVLWNQEGTQKFNNALHADLIWQLVSTNGLQYVTVIDSR